MCEEINILVSYFCAFFFVHLDCFVLMIVLWLVIDTTFLDWCYTCPFLKPITDYHS